MGKSSIEWTDETWNPVTGCTKVSQGCKHCYAERTWPRLAAPGQPYAGRPFTDIQIHENRADLPFRWVKPRRVFVNSMSDLFHEQIPTEFIDRLLAVMWMTPMHTYQVLTKRPERMRAYLQNPELGQRLQRWARLLQDRMLVDVAIDTDAPAKHIWWGVSAENAETLDQRAEILMEVPAAVRFVSLEPLLGSVWEALRWIFRRAEKHPNLYGKPDWIIVGCESGPMRRLCPDSWMLEVITVCRSAEVPVFVKQVSIGNYVSHYPEEWPDALRVREWPA